jgi:hypothetical protein
MEDYIKNYNLFDKIIVYDFQVGNGGIGDCIKFFMFILEDCIKNNIRLYYKKNNIEIEKYIKLKYDMYIEDVKDYKIVIPNDFYSTYNNYSININEVFYFTDEVIINSKKIFTCTTPYISIHLRLGDKYLETDETYIQCKQDMRYFSQEKIIQIIEQNKNEVIFFCCDNHNYKLNMKYKNILITNCNIGHTSLINTTNQQVLDAITEFYILTNSKIIYSASKSGFSETASKFNNIPLIYLF